MVEELVLSGFWLRRFSECGNERRWGGEDEESVGQSPVGGDSGFEPGDALRGGHDPQHPWKDLVFLLGLAGVTVVLVGVAFTHQDG